MKTYNSFSELAANSCCANNRQAVRATTHNVNIPVKGTRFWHNFLPEDLILRSDDNCLMLDSASENIHAEVHIGDVLPRERFNEYYEIGGEIDKAKSLAELDAILKKYKIQHLIPAVLDAYADKQADKE